MNHAKSEGAMVGDLPRPVSVDLEAACQPSHDPMPYAGTDVLELMEEAKNYNRYLSSLIGAHIKPGLKVLDFGAGSGTFALPLVRCGINLVCIEPDPALGTHLRKSGAKVAASLDEIEIGSVDMIYTFNVLEHVPDDATVLGELSQRLKPGGVLLIYVPAFNLLYSSFDRRVGHLRRYNRTILTNLVLETGLRVVYARYADSAGFLAALAYRALIGDNGTLSKTAIELYDRFAFPVSRLMDMAVSRWVGKNLVLIARKDNFRFDLKTAA